VYNFSEYGGCSYNNTRHALLNITNIVVFAIKEGIPLRYKFMMAETITHACKNDGRSNTLHRSSH